MADDSFSCIKEVTKNVGITLSSGYTSNEISGILDILESWKRQYIPKLKGIVVSYKNVSLTSKYAYIKLDSHIVHCDVKATFELFVPTVGSIVKGKINRISHDHIGCLVHDTINVTIDRFFSLSDGVSNFITLDHLILFQITRLEFKRKIIHVMGKITQECINLMKSLELFNSQSNAVESSLYSNTSFDSSEDSEIEERINDDTVLENGEESPSLLSCNYILQKSNSHIHKESVENILPNSSLFHSTPAYGGSDTSSSERNSSIGVVSHRHKSKKKDKNGLVEESEPSKKLSDEEIGVLPNCETLSKTKTKKHKKNSKSKSRKKLEDQTFGKPVKKKKSNKSEILANSNCDNNDKYAENLSNVSSEPPKKKRGKKLQIEQDNNNLMNETTDYSSDSSKKKKSKQSKSSSPIKNVTLNNSHLQNMSLDESSTDTSNHPSPSKKKRKHNKSADSLANSSLLFNDSLSSSKEDNDVFKVPKTPSKKKHKTFKSDILSDEIASNLNNFDSLLYTKDDIATHSVMTSMSPKKSMTKCTESIPKEWDTALKDSFEPPSDQLLRSEDLLNNIKEESDSSKKGKKRKRDLSERDGLPKKKKKKSESTSVSTGSKHKTKKKDKSKRDSKREKKNKSKKKVISSKKKLPKLKKKKKDKSKKSHTKKEKKSSKLKKKNVPFDTSMK